jgi:hypothetical protein
VAEILGRLLVTPLVFNTQLIANYKMFIIQAPYPTLQVTMLLPNPQFSDAESLLDTVNIKRAMDGTLYTYVHTRESRRKLSLNFSLTRNKALELRAFIQSYFSSKVKIKDHNNRVWVVNFTNNPFEYDTPERAAPAISPMPLGELQTITLEFEGIEIV